MADLLITDPNDPRFVEAMVVELRQLQDSGLMHVTIKPLDAYILIGFLQLAWRHPDVPQRQRAEMKAFADQFSGLFKGYPHLYATLQLGWRREFDVPTWVAPGSEPTAMHEDPSRTN